MCTTTPDLITQIFIRMVGVQRYSGQTFRYICLSFSEYAWESGMRWKQPPSFWRHQMCFTNFPGLWQALTERSIASARLPLVLSWRAPSSPGTIQPRIKSSQALPSASMGQYAIMNLVLIFTHLDLSLQRHLLFCFDSNLQAFYLARDVFWTHVEEDHGDIWMETVI